MKHNLKDNIWIEGFDSIDLANYFLKGVNYTQSKDKYVVYVGRTSEIPEEVAKECVEYVNGVNGIGYRDYLITTMVNHKETAKQSIQSACEKHYCIIYCVHNKIN